jgi:RNA polymerase sigma factor (sigma-70 family)
MNDSLNQQLSFRHLFVETTNALIRRFGLRHWDAIEDAVQGALSDAVTAWPRQEVREPAAWVYRVAIRKLIDTFRRDTVYARALAEIVKEVHVLNTIPDPDEIHDETLQMLFMCSAPSLNHDARIAISLKSVCGFSVREIASAFLASEETIKKRLQRARLALDQNELTYSLENKESVSARLESVLKTIYLILNEGYLSTNPDSPIREDLCGEAIRLSSLVAHDHRVTNSSCHALLALSLMHAARLSNRTDEQGIVIELAYQDRSKWNQELIKTAEIHLHEALRDELRSSFHLEAMIAWHHCIASSFSETNWVSVCKLYDSLIIANPSPGARLGRVIAMGHRDGPEIGFRALLDLSQNDLTQYDWNSNINYLLALAEYAYRTERIDHAVEYWKTAAEKSVLPWQKEWISRKISRWSLLP